MTTDELKAICKNGETQFVEFKTNANKPDQIIEEIVGFANSKGGSLFVGIDDDGALTGLKFAEDDAIFLIDYFKKNIDPIPQFEEEVIPISKKKSVLCFKVQSGDQKPYAVMNHNSSGTKVYFRVDDECLQASRELKSILKGNRLNKGRVIKYHDLENEVLKIVESHQPVSKKVILNHSSFTSRKISDCLIRLVLVGVLKIIPTPKQDLYEFSKQF